MNVLKPHVSLNVADIERSVAFYQKAFGVAASKRRPGYAKFDLESPSLNLTMVEAPRTGVNASHFGVQVASTADVEEARRRRDQVLAEYPTVNGCTLSLRLEPPRERVRPRARRNSGNAAMYAA